MQTEWKANTGYLALMNRSVQTLLLARRISKSISKLEKELAAKPDLDEEDKKKRWAELHRKNARAAHRHVLKYRGFLTKVGQAASIKAGDLPKQWVEELKGLQDELPVSNYKEVRNTIRADLGKPLEQIYKDFAERPIASASVAQAHMAHLKSGDKVCVKVQHAGVAKMVGTDLATIEFICAKAAKYHPDAPDFTDLIREWRRASREEVDFRRESKNAMDACAALRRHNVDVGCPEPLPDLCGRRVLTMAWINGWKVTDVDKLPPGTDREAIVGPLVDAFALLAFDEGLIHGDPHPGNVFAETAEADDKRPKRIRAALLDWGIVQRMTPAERAGAARWVVATLAQDRSLYIRSLLELGFVFDADVDPDSSGFNNFIEASLSSSAWMFRDSIPSSAQLHFMAQLSTLQDKQDKIGTRLEADDDGGKIISKIPGVVLFFLRGLEMLQNICGTLEVVVPFAKVVAQRAMPLLIAADAVPAKALPAPPGVSELECMLRQKLQELDDAGLILGAQVAVLAVTDPAQSEGREQDADDAGEGGAHRRVMREDWKCRVACGKTATVGGPVDPGTLLPLLDASTAVLLQCLLAAMAQKTVTGKEVTFETRVQELWPDFAQREKGSTTVGEVLQHRAGLVRTFPRDLTLRGFCHELRMEQYLAMAPRDAGAAPPPAGAPPAGEAAEEEEEEEGPVVAESVPSRAVGTAAAAMLRRAVGVRTCGEAVRKVLGPLELQDDILYAGGPDERMAHVGKLIRQSFSMENVYEWLEEKAQGLEQQERSENLPPWLTWREFAADRTSCADPLVVNRDSLRRGEGCIPSRGLRASAEALCRLFTADIVPQSLLAQSRGLATRLRFDSVHDWREFGNCQDIGVGGWQLFRFRRLADNLEVIGHGRVDGATGSFVMRLPDHCIAVLLTSLDKKSQDVAPSLLRTIASHLGLQRLWPEEPPRALLPKTAALVPTTSTRPSATIPGQAPGPQPSRVRELESRLAELRGAVRHQRVQDAPPDAAVGLRSLGGLPKGREQLAPEGEEDGEEEDGEDPEEEAAAGLGGSWKSAETQGLEALLEAFDVPPMMAALAAQAQREVRIKVEGDNVSLSTTTRVMGNVVEDTSTQFTIGRRFEGEQELGGTYHGSARWVEGVQGSGCPGLVVAKNFKVEGRTFTLEERLELVGQNRLSLTTTLKAPEEQRVRVGDAEEREILCASLDPSNLKLRRELEIGGEQLIRNGIVVAIGTGGTARPTFAEVSKMKVPVSVLVRYEDLQSTTFYDREGLIRKPLAKAKARQSSTRTPASEVVSGTKPKEASEAVKSTQVCTRTKCPPVERVEMPQSMPAPVDTHPLAKQGQPQPEQGGDVVERQPQRNAVVRPAGQAGALAQTGCTVGLLSTGLAFGSLMKMVLLALGRALDTACLAGGEMKLRAIDAQREVDQKKRLNDAVMELHATGPRAAANAGSLRRAGLVAAEVVTSPQDGLDDVSVYSQASSRTLPPAGHRPSATAGATMARPAVPEPRQPPTLPAAQPKRVGEGSSSCCSLRSSCCRGGGQAAVPPVVPQGPVIPEPRPVHGLRGHVAVVAFCGFDAEAMKEDAGLYGHSCLSNFFDLGAGGLRLEAPCTPGKVHSFRNAAAAFYALQYWALASRFSTLSGQAALEKTQRLAGHADRTYGGFGGPWSAMMAVLSAKFAPGTAAAAALLATGDMYLLARGAKLGMDKVWSDNSDGQGLNWLGLQLMLVRDRLAGTKAWTQYIRRLLDGSTGTPFSPAARNEWQDIVWSATLAVTEKLHK